MASEITISGSLSVTLSGAVVAATKSKVLSISGNECIQYIDTVASAADAALALAGLDTLGYVQVENLDATNFISLSTGTGGSFAAGVFATIRAGCLALFQPGSASVYAKADTADCIVRVTAVEV